MCTALTLKTRNFYFGRTLDLDKSYSEEVVITPRKFCFYLRNGYTIKTHYAIIGTAYVKDNFPLYYDAVNEMGLCIAGLNFVNYAYYSKECEGRINVAQFEFIPYLLSKCASVRQAEEELKNMNVTDTPFSDDLPVADLHWIISDKEKSITVEYTREGVKIYDNPIGILTNNPPFDMQLFNLNNYINITPEQPHNRFSENINLDLYSLGMGAIGLPGDCSSQSRFVRAAFNKLNSVTGEGETDGINQFFHILGGVQFSRGCCKGVNDYEITVYTSCCDVEKSIYYYTTYENHMINAVKMHNVNLDDEELFRYPHIKSEQFNFQN